MYKENPKTAGSGIFCCIPQTGICPMRCPECFFQNGRSFLEPLSENLPNVPPNKGVIRMNDGNDSNINRNLVLAAADTYDEVFFNTSIPILDFPGPVVLTVNPPGRPAVFLENVPKNLMFVRVLMSMMNLDTVIGLVVHYTRCKVPVVLTFMAYHNDVIPEVFRSDYNYRKRTLNSYWAITFDAWKLTMGIFVENPLVHSCGTEGIDSKCKNCGNCLREYFATKERVK